MGSRLALLVAAAALGSSFATALPAVAQVLIDGKKLGIEMPAGVERGTVPAEGAESKAAPKQLPPPPRGCPYRDRKLELIV